MMRTLFQSPELIMSRGLVAFEKPYKFDSAVQISYEYLAYDIQNYFYKRKLDLSDRKAIHKVEPQKL